MNNGSTSSPYKEGFPKQGYNLIVPAFVLTLVFLLFFGLSQSILSLIFAIIFFISALFFIFFFRDPQRKIPQEENLVLAPADGRVISLENFENHPFLESKGTKLSIFLSLWDVHINRAPISGKVVALKYNPGKFNPAFKKKASSENEQNEIWLESDKVKVVLKQIAGILARRIVCHLKEGDEVKAGQRFGMIKFGSRVDIFLPEKVKIEVALNQKVKAGETVIGRF
jgi:phosphatidylserine decarboxylase